MKKTKKALSTISCCILSFLLSFTSAQAQENRTVTGRVAAPTGEPLVGATVAVKGADVTLGTITDYEGEFSLVVPAGRDTLSFSW